MQLTCDWLNTPASSVVMTALTVDGAAAFFVGGCVRNALLGLPVNDLDIATSLHPENVIELAARAGLKTVPTGLAHGTVTVICDGQPFEVTTFRRDVETDGRRAVVAFARNMHDDAIRRDFTINAIYADRFGIVHDPLNGLPDIAGRRLRFIGTPHDRIREDYLRILRFFRFLAQLDIPTAEAPDLSACTELAAGINSLSPERITAELIKLLGASDPSQALHLMAETGVLTRVLPQCNVKLVSKLMDVERASGLAPDWRRRLMVLGGTYARLRLSKRDTRFITQSESAISVAKGPRQRAQEYGVDAALIAAVMEATILGTDLSADLEADLIRGRDAQFPIKAVDLIDRFQKRALGDEIKRLRRIWLDSDMQLSAAELLAHDRA